MNIKIKKPSFEVLYIFRFPKYVATWRLKTITDGGYFFWTSKGGVTSIVTPSRFDFMVRRFLLDEVAFPTPATPAPSQQIKVSVANTSDADFMRRTYTKEFLDSLVDNIDDIEF